MSEIAIKIEGLGKRYKIGTLKRHDTLRDQLAYLVGKRFSRNGNGNHALSRGLPASQAMPDSASDTLWALKDVSFEVKRGEVVGLIGRNGAGKSTLLKILSRITDPTEGYADISGRIGSLLEVGTGFHPELTGRENIYLNGSILGMKRAEITSRFDEIVAFAEVEKFIDTPVKHYSSGMYVRLAFAVAAHMETEILLVDEVLAVGDAAFQKKCLGKMGEVARDGRTVLFVSHDMPSVGSLCSRVIVFEAGRPVMLPNANAAISYYLSMNSAERTSATWDVEHAPGDETMRITRVEVSGLDTAQTESLWLAKPIRLAMDFTILKAGMRINPVFAVKNSLGVLVFSTANYEESSWGTRHYERGHFRTVCEIPAHILNEGKYVVDATLVQETRFVRVHIDNAVGFTVVDEGTTRGDYLGEWRGLVRPRCEWHTVQANEGEMPRDT
ncbi:MAG TPA: ABC transporter ATP-binding protein [Pyrinomonadaceae bacterium]